MEVVPYELVQVSCFVLGVALVLRAIPDTTPPPDAAAGFRKSTVKKRSAEATRSTKPGFWKRIKASLRAKLLWSPVPQIEGRTGRQELRCVVRKRLGRDDTAIQGFSEGDLTRSTILT